MSDFTLAYKVSKTKTTRERGKPAIRKTTDIKFYGSPPKEGRVATERGGSAAFEATGKAVVRTYYYGVWGEITKGDVVVDTLNNRKWKVEGVRILQQGLVVALDLEVV